MVGIVVVSHSALVAEGVVEMVRQMAGDAPLAAAGGIDDPANPIGTDAVKVLEAIEAVWSDDGVVVLMDLGSAVLSADFALDMLGEPRRRLVRLSGAPLVEGAMAAAVAAAAGAPLERVAAEARRALQPKASQLEPEPDHSPPAGAEVGRSVVLPVTNPTGLHARPAARFVAIAARFDARVTVANRTTGAGPVPADSFSAVGTLGARQGHELEVRADGPEAEAALAALVGLAADGFGDEPAEAVAPEPAGPGAGGVGASPGMAVGPARRLVTPDVEASEVPEGDHSHEWARVEEGLRAAEAGLRRARDAARSRAGGAAEILDAQLLLLEDAALLADVRRRVEEGAAAPAAWAASIAEVADRFRRLEDPYQRERVADVEDVGRRVLAGMAGIDPDPVPSGTGILVADDLDPASTAHLSPDRVVGILTAGGGPTSHTAILARAMGIPAVVGAGRQVLEVPEGTMLVIDGSTGRVVVGPSPSEAEEARRAMEEERGRREVAAAEAAGPAVTRDGLRVEVAANIGRVEEAADAVRAGADGVGLLRTEFLFLGRREPPTEEEQVAAYRALCEALGGRRLVLRTLDVGGDKPLPFVSRPPEANPFLGVRGVRLGLAEPGLLVTQLRAALRVAVDHPVGIMFPMVSGVEEWRDCRRLVEETIAALGSGRPEGLEVGVMVEVPSVALVAPRLEVDFFSLGTNDLTQYTLAAERGNPALAWLADPLHPAVLQLVDRTCRAGAERGAWVGVCGEAAADPEAVPVLLGLGVTELSAAPPAVPGIKRAVRAVEVGSCAELARRVLDLGSAAEVRDTVRRWRG